MAAVRAWLQELQRARDEEIDFQKACDALEKAIDDNEKLGGLEKLAAAALRFDRGMPDLLAARFGSRMQELKRVAKRRFALVLTGTVLSLALVAFGVTRILSWRGRVQERGRWQDQIAQALDAGDLERAGELLSHLEKRAPELLNSPEIKGLRARYEQGIGAEKVRRETFDGVMASLQKEWQGSPDPPSARRKLRRAEKLAAKYEEKTKVEDWRQTIQAHADAQDRKLENEHKRQLDELQTCYNELLDAQQKGEESVEIVARRCLAMAAALINAEDIPAPLKARALAIQDATRRTRKAIRDKIARRTATRKALGDIASAYKSPTTLAERLRSFTQDYPDHPLTPDFARSVRMEPHWRAVKEWARSTAHWGAHVEVHSSRTVGARLIRLKEYLKDHPGSAYQAAAAEYRQYLEKGKDVITEDELKGLTSVQNMLSGRIYAPNLYTVFTKSRERYYYFASKHAPFPSTGGVNYITDLRLRTRHTNIAPRQLIGKPEVAPHSAFAERALKLLRSFKGPGWATLYLRLAELARTQPDMDPILRARLLKISLRYAGGTIAWHAERVQKTIDQLDKFAPDFKLDVPWPDPKDHDANRFRPEIQNALYRIDSFKGLIREVEERIKELPNRLSRHHVVGVMLGDAGEVQLKSAAQTGDLYVLWADGQQAPTYNKIGTVKNGAPLIDKKAASRYPRGNPIFMRR